MVLGCNMCKLSRELSSSEDMCPIHGTASWEDYEEYGGLTP